MDHQLEIMEYHCCLLADSISELETTFLSGYLVNIKYLLNWKIYFFDPFIEYFDFAKLGQAMKFPLFVNF
jgi:hypothetical protein